MGFRVQDSGFSKKGCLGVVAWGTESLRCSGLHGQKWLGGEPVKRLNLNPRTGVAGLQGWRLQEGLRLLFRESGLGLGAI